MSLGSNAAVGERIAKAREFLSLTQAAVAQQMGLARTTEVAIEQGRRPVSVAELYRYADVLSRPLDYFLGVGPWAQADVGAHFRKMAELLDSRAPRGKRTPGRPKAPLAVSPEKRSLMKFEALCRNYLELEELNGLPRAAMPQLPLPRHFSPLEGEQLAATVRAHLDIGPDVPLGDLRVRLEEAFALRVFVQGGPGLLSAAAFQDPSVGGCVLLVERPILRMRFTLAHALGHLLATRDSPLVDVHESNRRTPVEAFATAFAGALLVPARGLRERFGAVHREVGEFNDIAILFLARTFGVSLKALRSRLQATKLVTPAKLKKIDEAIREANAAKGGPEASLMLPDQPRWEALPERYVFLAMRAHRKGLIDRVRLGAILGTSEEGSALRLIQYLASVHDDSGEDAEEIPTPQA
jgi:Zn-dependent peptidase ImmA (M78 family)/transcriptional regulator with XRE-family HTH domain